MQPAEPAPTRPLPRQPRQPPARRAPPLQVDGLPATALGLAAQPAKGAGHEEATAEEGPWLFTLDFPSY